MSEQKPTYNAGQTPLAFRTESHKDRFVTAIKNKIYDGNRIDTEYATAFYILTSGLATWNKAQGYVTENGIVFETMLEEVDFSSGEAAMVRLAGNLFNDGYTTCNPVNLMLLDEPNFQTILLALKLRRYGATITGSGIETDIRLRD